MLNQVEDAVAEGFSEAWVYSLWGVSDDRVYRWRQRLSVTGTLIDQVPGGCPSHGIMPSEERAIVELAERWGEVDRSHRKLAHRGSYTETVWVSPSTVRRVLALTASCYPNEGLASRSGAARGPPARVGAEPYRGSDVTHFTRAGRCAFALIDAISRKWIDTLVSVEETSTGLKVVFEHASSQKALST